MEKIIKVFKDFVLIYKNFIAWNVSKITILFFTIILVFIILLPFLIVGYIVSLYDSINWSYIYNTLLNSDLGLKDPNVVKEFLNNKFFSFIYILLIITSIGTIIFGLNYSNFILAKFHLNYIRGEKIFDIKKYFFSLEKIKKYFLITINFVLYLTLPIIFFLVSYFILLLFFPDSLKASNIFSNFIIEDNFSFFLISITVITIFYFFYLVYRIIFSYIILNDEQNYISKLRYSFYIKESIRLTKGFKNFFIFLFFSIFLIFLLSPILNFGEKLKQNLVNDIKILDSKNSYYKFIILLDGNNHFKNKNLDYVEIKKDIMLYSFYLIIYFLFILGLFNLFIVSFYERFLIINRLSVLNEKYGEGVFLVKKKIKVVRKKSK